MRNFWMVRAGAGGKLAEEFKRLNVVAMDFEGIDLTEAVDEHRIRKLAQAAYQDRKPGFIPVAAGAWHRFRFVLKRGDAVVTYDPARRTYLFGDIAGDYRYQPGLIDGHEQIRPVIWKGELNRDELSQAAKNTLGSTLALFDPGQTVLAEVEAKLNGVPSSPATIATVDVLPSTAEDDVERIRRDVVERGHEFIKDKINSLDWDELQESVAAILRAMGTRPKCRHLDRIAVKTSLLPPMEWGYPHRASRWK